MLLCNNPFAGNDDKTAFICADDSVLMHVAAHADSFAIKRMRKIGQRRAVDYTSTGVWYMQVICYSQISLSFINGSLLERGSIML